MITELCRLLKRRRRLVRTCICGRPVPRREAIDLLSLHLCPDCGSSCRRWERRCLHLSEILKAWLELRRYLRKVAP